MTEKLIKSDERVKDHGEVFTPKDIVDKMLDQPEITAKINDLNATFLEPSAGEGAFLVEILKRKMFVAEKESATAKQYNKNALLALSTLYGIELLEDNVEMLVMNMIRTFDQCYYRTIAGKFDTEPDEQVLKSAMTIIKANMAQGDALKGIDANGNPILFSEWLPVEKNKVQRIEYTFDAIKNGGGPVASVQEKQTQISIFDTPKDEEDKSPARHYAICPWKEVYKEEIVEDIKEESQEKEFYDSK